MLSWDNEEKGEGLKIVIMKNVWSKEEAESGGENFFEEIRLDIEEECKEKLGSIQRIKIFEENTDGVVEIKFKEASSAEQCIKLMNGRFFGGNKIECFYYDGVTNYKRTALNDIEEEKRIEEFGKWLETQD